MLTFKIDTSSFDGDNNPPETQVEDIVVVNPEGNWHLYNHGSLELTRDCDFQYKNLWKLPRIPTFVKNILIIGGGDFQLVDLLFDRYVYPNVTLVDPHVEKYKEFHKFYLGTDKTESYHKKINKVPMVFSEYIKQNNDFYFDLILIDCSEPEFDLTSEIYCEEFFNTLREFNINDRCKHLMYLPPKRVNDLIPIINSKFNYVSLNGRFIPDWNEYCDICYFTDALEAIRYENTIS